MQKITHKYTNIDGTDGTRSNSNDFGTLPMRFLQRMLKIVGETNTELLNKIEIGLNWYKHAKYENALKVFKEVVAELPSLETELSPFMETCERVLSKEKNSNDLLYEEYLSELKDWNSRSFLYKLLHAKRKPHDKSRFSFGDRKKVRCKYCGHYTPYIDPYEGFAYFDTNNCIHCRRGYPVPSVEWDNIDGLAYIYYRNSVTEKKFYDEFESKYDVNPKRDHFLVKSDTKA